MNKIFKFNNIDYIYYNSNTERAIEVPIVYRYFSGINNGDILEVGNVLNNYIKTNHTVVDKYEKFEGVINKDIIEYLPDRKFKLIVCISTLEHIGFDEKEGRNLHKCYLAFNHMKSLLDKSGKIIITVPLGFNYYLDKLIFEEKIKFDEIYCARRITNLGNDWIQVDWDKIKNHDHKHFELLVEESDGYEWTKRCTVDLLIGVVNNV